MGLPIVEEDGVTTSGVDVVARAIAGSYVGRDNR